MLSHVIKQLSVRQNISVICWQYVGSGHLHDGLNKTTTEISTTQTEVGKYYSHIKLLGPTIDRKKFNVFKNLFVH